MAARIIHFGADNCHRLWVLKSAGYFIDDCQSVVQLRTALQSGINPDAVAFTENERFAPGEAVEVTRSHSSAPLILFRETHNDCVESVFDLVVPVLEPPEAWLTSVAALIAKSQAIRASTEVLIKHSMALRQGAEEVCRQTRKERERSRHESVKPVDPWTSLRGKLEPPREN
jgi:hypothetical protein